MQLCFGGEPLPLLATVGECGLEDDAVLKLHTGGRSKEEADTAGLSPSGVQQRADAAWDAWYIECRRASTQNLDPCFAMFPRITLISSRAVRLVIGLLGEHHT